MPAKDTSTDASEQPGTKLTISKMDAARQQLATAIELWFRDGDPVSIHTLAFAAYEIIHVVSKKRGRQITLIFDSDMIKDEYRNDWAKIVKREANFFKHGDRDSDATISFGPVLSELYILICLAGLGTMGTKWGDIESAFFWWTVINKPRFLTDEGRKLLEDRIEIEQFALPHGIRKAEFFEQFLKSRQIS
jgi:hypothetical protein